MLLTRKRRIWIADDDPQYCDLIQRVLTTKRPEWEVVFFLQSHRLQEQLQQSPELLPDLLVMDLNMPHPTGWEVLQFIKQQPHLKSIPTVVLSESDSDEDAATCYAAGANSYIVKPSGLEQLRHFVEVTCQYWLDVAAAPSNKRL